MNAAARIPLADLVRVSDAVAATRKRGEKIARLGQLLTEIPGPRVGAVVA